MSRKLTGKLPSGWCMTDYHSGCPVNFDHGKCVCSCHSGVTPKVEKFDKTFVPAKPLVAKSATTDSDVATVPKRRGRPPGSKNKPKNVSFDIRPIQKVSSDIRNVSQDIRRPKLSSMIKALP